MSTRTNTKQRQGKRGGQAANPQAMVRRDPAASQRIGGGQVAKPKAQQVKKEEKRETTGAIRLDINLEAEVHIKARLHGDLTLAIEM
jgi:hypothetical protein